VRRSRRRPLGTRRLGIAAALVIALGFAGAMVLSLVKVTRAPAPGPFRLPTPVSAAGAAAQPGEASGPAAAPAAADVAPHP